MGPTPEGVKELGRAMSLRLPPTCSPELNVL